MIDIDLSQFTSLEDAALTLGISLGHARNLISSGVLEAVKSPFGGKMIKCSSVEQYMAKRKETGRPRRKASQ